MARRAVPGRWVLALVLGSLPATADTQPLDPGYTEQRSAEREPAERRVKSLVWPSLTAPALVRRGGRFEVLLLPKRLGSSVQASDWRVWLRRRGRTWACAVRRVRSGGRRALALQVEVPVELARDVYELRVVGNGTDDIQPSSVRVFGDDSPANYRFAVIADHQLWDPSYQLGGRELNGGGYPRRDKEAGNVGIARQGLAELALLDPDFVLHLGDLSFGLDYGVEVPRVRTLLEDARLPIFAVPGNHDAYAEYEVKLRGGMAGLLTGALGCRRHLEGDLGWGKAWSFVTCVHGDVKHLLYADLRRDGLAAWRRQLGPPTYSFVHGRLRFVGLNTFDGTPQRRHAFSLYLDVFDLKLGAPAVDNHGGYLGAPQLQFLRREVELARQQGQGLVVFGHHDPRGNLEGTRYHPNEPFPTDPLALGGFEEWNFDSEAWDSDPGDGRTRETVDRNSAVELLGILARSGGYYLSGHRHEDQRTVYESGNQLGPFRVERRLEFIRTTSASSLVRGRSYNGYRLISVRGDRLEAVDYAPARELGSVPAGNLWLQEPPGRDRGAGPGPEGLSLSCGLPLPTSVVVRWELPARAEGYRFRTVVPAGPRRSSPTPRVLEVEAAGERADYRVGLELPAVDGFPPPAPGAPPSWRLQATPARGNRPPRPELDVTPVGGSRLAPGRNLEARIGQPLLLSAERSTDPDGDRIIATLWELGDGRTARGSRLLHTFSGPGLRRITLALVDEAGARSRRSFEITVRPPSPPGCAGCCAASSSGNAAFGAALPLLLLLARRGERGRRRRRNR